jgi:hypothetical protein
VVEPSEICYKDPCYCDRADTVAGDRTEIERRPEKNRPPAGARSTMPTAARMRLGTRCAPVAHLSTIPLAPTHISRAWS